MKSYEFSAKTVEKAIEMGLAELGKSQEDFFRSFREQFVNML